MHFLPHSFYSRIPPPRINEHLHHLFLFLFFFFFTTEMLATVENDVKCHCMLGRAHLRSPCKRITSFLLFFLSLYLLPKSGVRHRIYRRARWKRASRQETSYPPVEASDSVRPTCSLIITSVNTLAPLRRRRGARGVISFRSRIEHVALFFAASPSRKPLTCKRDHVIAYRGDGPCTADKSASD